jgi:hypothetical protein
LRLKRDSRWREMNKTKNIKGRGRKREKEHLQKMKGRREKVD